jgi:hypothetical protein
VGGSAGEEDADDEEQWVQEHGGFGEARGSSDDADERALLPGRPLVEGHHQPEEQGDQEGELDLEVKARDVAQQHWV